MATTITYRLSSIDQSVTRAYMRCALLFPCGNDETTRNQIVANLTTSVKRAISTLPIFAGKVHAIGADNQAALHDSVLQDSIGIQELQQAGRVEVRVTLAQVNDFKATSKILSDEESPSTYQQLSAANMPADAFVNEALMPLPDSPNDEGAPAFVVQANFIDGGVTVCLYLHSSVADEKGMAKIMTIMSNVGGKWLSKAHTQQSLEEDARRQSSMRDRWSGSRGVKADQYEHPEYDVAIRKPTAPSVGITSRVLNFSLGKIKETQAMLNERFQYIYEKPEIHVSDFDTLAAVLWKAISRARKSILLPPTQSRLFIPVDMSNRLDCPLDSDEYCGNSCLFGFAKMPLSHARLPFDVSSMVMAARNIRNSRLCMTEAKVRSAIALINGVEDLQALNNPNIDFGTDVYITDWSDLPSGEKAGLGLGLGNPEWTRKFGRSQSLCECLVLPQNKEQRAWEVTVSMAGDEMERLLQESEMGRDGDLAPFLVHPA